MPRIEETIEVVKLEIDEIVSIDLEKRIIKYTDTEGLVHDIGFTKNSN